MIIFKNVWKLNVFIVKINKNNLFKLFVNVKFKIFNKGIKFNEVVKFKKSEIKEILVVFFCFNFV